MGAERGIVGGGVSLVPVYLGDIDECLRVMSPFYEYEDFDPGVVADRICSGEVLPLSVVDVERERVLAMLTVDIRGRRCEVRNAAGHDMHAWLERADEVLCALAREQGCKTLSVKGRPGWRRVLAARGFRTVWAIMEREL